MTQTKRNFAKKSNNIDESNVHENKRTYWKSDKGEKMNNVHPIILAATYPETTNQVVTWLHQKKIWQKSHKNSKRYKKHVKTRVTKSQLA